MKLSALFLALALFACTPAPKRTAVPAERDLMHAASQHGKHRATLERYDPETLVAVVRTPGWLPESKPYQFDGATWIPLWSPFAPDEAEGELTGP